MTPLHVRAKNIPAIQGLSRFDGFGKSDSTDKKYHIKLVSLTTKHNLGQRIWDKRQDLSGFSVRDEVRFATN
jgi:hypothetical protein